MKGVIWGIAPHARIADLSHLISPQNVAEGALVLFRSAPYFPSGTVHVAVVDPGVGTSRRPIAAKIGAQRFVCPDNGLLTLLLERAEQERAPIEIVHLNRPGYWLPEISQVFHGRDIFAPVAGHLANGVPLIDLGPPISDPIRLQLPRPERVDGGLRGEVIHIDHFGNISTSIRREHLAGQDELTVRLSGVEVRGLVNTFGERSPGDLVALVGSTGNLLVCEVNGSAARRLSVKAGDPVDVIFQSQ